MTCNITGVARLPNGNPMAETKIRFRKLSGVGSLGDGTETPVIFPTDVNIFTDENGKVDFDMYPGTYEGKAYPKGQNTETFLFGVPDSDTAIFGACVDLVPELDPSAVSGAAITSAADAGASAMAAAASAQAAETAAGIARSPAASLYGACGGSANAITVTAGLTGIAIGTEIRFRATAANTGPATLNVDGTGAIPCRTITGAVLPAGYIRTTVDTVARYDGTYWVLGREIERGSNANGEYVRFADGTQICTYSAVGAAGPITIAEGALWRSWEYSWTFPASFTTDTNLAVNGSLGALLALGVAWLKVRVKDTTGAGMMLLAARSNANNFTVNFSAIGRWY